MLASARRLDDALGRAEEVASGFAFERDARQDEMAVFAIGRATRVLDGVAIDRALPPSPYTRTTREGRWLGLASHPPARHPRDRVRPLAKPFAVVSRHPQHLADQGQRQSGGKIVCWKDKAGKTVGCGDKVPPEYQDNATKELNRRGVTVNSFWPMASWTLSPVNQSPYGQFAGSF